MSFVLFIVSVLGGGLGLALLVCVIGWIAAQVADGEVHRSPPMGFPDAGDPEWKMLSNGLYNNGKYSVDVRHGLYEANGVLIKSGAKRFARRVSMAIAERDAIERALR